MPSKGNPAESPLVTDKPKYRAPALQKGLEILETLARAPSPMPMSDISVALGRSKNEIFRMLQVLEEHGYIARNGDGYRLTNRLFALGMQQPPMRDLLSAALPEMHGLAEATGQSCHLAVVSGGEMVVVARVEAPGQLGFAVRVGYRRPLPASASGRVLLAFQGAERTDAMLQQVDPAALADAPGLAAELDRIRSAGHVEIDSRILAGVTDLSVPILTRGEAEAALTIPHVNIAGATASVADVVVQLHRHAERIAEALQPSSDGF